MKAKSRQSGIIPDPVATLVHEHADTLVQLGHLRHAAESIRANGFSASAFEEIAGTILFIDRELRVHNIKEERYLFPRLREHAEAMIDNLLGDHAKLLKVFDGLTRAIQDMENSRIRDTSVKDLLTSAETVAQLLHKHIQIENEALFPLAKKFLTEEQYQSFGRDMANSIN